jgi:hypothetical protein
MEDWERVALKCKTQTVPKRHLNFAEYLGIQEKPQPPPAAAPEVHEETKLPPLVDVGPAYVAETPRKASLHVEEEPTKTSNAEMEERVNIQQQIEDSPTALSPIKLTPRKKARSYRPPLVHPAVAAQLARRNQSAACGPSRRESKPSVPFRVGVSMRSPRRTFIEAPFGSVMPPLSSPRRDLLMQ